MHHTLTLVNSASESYYTRWPKTWIRILCLEDLDSEGPATIPLLMAFVDHRQYTGWDL